jgi:uncharacterized membrane protein YdfJ with MMPL/SSD domain
MFYRLGHFAAYQSWIVCAAWLVLGVALTVVAPAWDAKAQDDDVRFVPERFTSVRAYQLLEKAFPDDVFACRVVFALEREDSASRTPTLPSPRRSSRKSNSSGKRSRNGRSARSIHIRAGSSAGG